MSSEASTPKEETPSIRVSIDAESLPQPLHVSQSGTPVERPYQYQEQPGHHHLFMNQSFHYPRYADTLQRSSHNWQSPEIRSDMVAPSWTPMGGPQDIVIRHHGNSTEQIPEYSKDNSFAFHSSLSNLPETHLYQYPERSDQVIRPTSKNICSTKFSCHSSAVFPVHSTVPRISCVWRG